MALEAGYEGCPMYDGGLGVTGYGMHGSFPWFWLLSLLIVAGAAVLITYLIMDSKKRRTTHRSKKKR